MVVLCSERQERVIYGRRQNLMKGKKCSVHRKGGKREERSAKTELTRENGKFDIVVEIRMKQDE